MDPVRKDEADRTQETLMIDARSPMVPDHDVVLKFGNPRLVARQKANPTNNHLRPIF